jgi:hypothetical protein
MADTEHTKEKLRAYHRAWEAANRQRLREQHRAWDAANQERRAYSRQKRGAKRRGILWLFTFEEWREVWQTSGKWEQRGPRKGQYVMARYSDAGPYSRDNTRICTTSENCQERGKCFSAETRKRLSETHKGRPHSAETRQKLSVATKLHYARLKSGH